MDRVKQTVQKLAVLLVATVWFLTAFHTAVCHSENVLCGHDGCSESTVCMCASHIAIEPASEPILVIEPKATAWVPSHDETVRALLLPDDIFRPPLARR